MINKRKLTGFHEIQTSISSIQEIQTNSSIQTSIQEICTVTI